MTVQLAVRLPDAMVEGIDSAVSRGWSANRTRLVESAVERELRRLAAEHDARLLREHGAADDLDGLVDWTMTQLGGLSVDLA